MLWDLLKNTPEPAPKTITEAAPERASELAPKPKGWRPMASLLIPGPFLDVISQAHLCICQCRQLTSRIAFV